MCGLFIWMIAGAVVGTKVVENRPTFNLANISVEYAPLCISVVSDMGEIIYTVTGDKYEENNIRLHLKKGHYSIYFSDFVGGSIQVKASMR